MGELTSVHRFQCIAKDIPVQPLVDRIEAMPELWTEITARQTTPGTPHHDTESIFLRWCAGESVEEAFFDLIAIDYPAAKSLLPEVAAPFDQALDAITTTGAIGEIGRVMIPSLRAGGRIDEHSDWGPYATKFDRFHLILKSEPGNVFHVGDASFGGRPGDLWWFNHKLPHSVENNSGEPRWHMIIDVEAPHYRAFRGTTFERERLVDMYDEAIPLLQSHYEEIAFYRDIPLSPNRAIYEASDRSGNLRVYTVRDAGTLIGYGVFAIALAPHYTTSLQASEDVLYLRQDARGKTIGYRFLAWCDEQLRAEGVQVVSHHVKKHHPALGKLLVNLGYDEQETIYTRRLD